MASLIQMVPPRSPEPQPLLAFRLAVGVASAVASFALSTWLFAIFGG